VRDGACRVAHHYIIIKVVKELVNGETDLEEWPWSPDSETCGHMSVRCQCLIPRLSAVLIESTKAKEPDLHLEFIFDKLFAAANAFEDKDAIVKFLKAIKIQLESAPSTKPHKPAKSFTLEDAVDCFSLTHGSDS
jgi:hypothetical protein